MITGISFPCAEFIILGIFPDVPFRILIATPPTIGMLTFMFDLAVLEKVLRNTA